MLLTNKCTLLIYALIGVNLQVTMMHNKGHLKWIHWLLHIIHICNIVVGAAGCIPIARLPVAWLSYALK